MAVIDQHLTDRWALYNGDSCEVLPLLPDESVYLSVYSPPFATEFGGCLYCYSSSSKDLSNCRNYDEFFEHYEFIVKEIERLTVPGRITAVHCIDVPKKGANIAGWLDFPGDIIKLHERCGFEMLPRICIWKEPLAVRNRTMLKSLAHRQIVDDSTLTNVCGADYLIPFRKKGKNPVPVKHPSGLTEYHGARAVPTELFRYRGWTGKQTENLYSHWVWRCYASSVWDDIRGNQGNREQDTGGVLSFNSSREDTDERHVHPLQLDVIRRAVTLWTNEGEVVLDPFSGVGSTVYGAVELGRKGVGVELKPTYFRQAIDNLGNVEERKLRKSKGFFA